MPSHVTMKPLDIPLTSPQFLGLFLVLTLIVYTVTRKRSLFPPGPRGLPLVGNIFDVPNTFQWLTYEEWGRKYKSPIVHIKMFGTRMMVVNDHEVAHNLFEKTGNRYGDKPRLMLLREIAGHDWNFGFAPLDAHWKLCRRTFDNEFKPSAVKNMRPQMTRFIRTLFLRRLVESPARFIEHCHFMAVALSLDTAYGLDIKNDDDPFLNVVHDCLQSINESSNYQYVDVFPWMTYLPTWIPGMDWKQKSTHWKHSNVKMRDTPFDSVVKAIKEQTACPSVSSSLLEADERLDEGSIKDIAAMIIVGKIHSLESCVPHTMKAQVLSGSVDTVVSMLQCTFLVLSLFPEAQKAAQDELDRVVGSERLPDFDDESNLPYVKAFYKELLRWACVTPIISHLSMEDDVWVNEGKNYFIPKGTMVLGNSWAMSRDERTYPDPHKFSPARYLNENGKINLEIKEADMIFGFRPRYCSGKWYAEDLIFIFIATILSVFRVETEDGELPKIAEWSKLMKPGMVVYPLPFKVKITPRSEKAVDLARQAEIHA